MYHTLSVRATLRALKTSKRGLTQKEAQARLAEYGRNEIVRRKKADPFAIFARQFASPLIAVLIFAAFVAAVIGKFIDSMVIFAILAINAALGFVQEWRAERAIEEMAKALKLKCAVVRDGKEIVIDAEEVVPGDIVVLEAGAKVPADGRIIFERDLACDEAPLTGESTPVAKADVVLPLRTEVADRRNCVWAGTTVVSGSARAAVFATGARTQYGQIATLVEVVEEVKTSFQVKMEQIAKFLAAAVIVVCGAIFAGMVARAMLAKELSSAAIFDFFFVALALGVAAVPEGLPAVVAITLALGVRTLAARNALARRLSAVEGMGEITVICADKTGTMTKGMMEVRSVFVDCHVVTTDAAILNETAKFAAQIGTLCNNANLEERRGDPTELALLKFAILFGFTKATLEKVHERIDEIPFSSERKMMSTLNKFGKGILVCTKGAPEVVLRKCTKIRVRNVEKKLTPAQAHKIAKINEQFARRGLRVIAIAHRYGSKKLAKDPEKGLTFDALLALSDPPREGVADALRECERMGLDVMMLTGDHALTAKAIADEIGLKGDVMSGAELDKISDEELRKITRKVKIFARITPHHKVRIAHALQENGEIVAMTGDGINDAPALKKANVGIAMGMAGTDVAREAADIILLDDNFVSIVKAIEEGRGIVKTINDFVQYVLASNVGEILIIATAVALAWPLPLLAVQILMVNLLTDGLPAIALSLDKRDIGELGKEEGKGKSEKGVITRSAIVNIILIGTIIGIFALGLFNAYGKDEKARTIAFTALVTLQLSHVLTYRTKKAVFNPIKNKWLAVAVFASFAVQLAIVHTPLSAYFYTQAIGWSEWATIILAAVVLGVMIEVKKAILKF